MPCNPIRDAASLILVRDMDTDPKVLLGRRASSNRFMPGRYVFPGGVLQSEDFQASAAAALDGSCAGRMGVRGVQADTDELSDLRWIRPAEWRTLPLVDITIYLLNRFEQILHRAQHRQSFVFRHHRGRAQVKWQGGTPTRRTVRDPP